MAAKGLVRNLEDEFETPARSDGDSSQTEECIDVFLRVRPFLNSEKQEHCQSCVEIEKSKHVVLKAPKDSATFKNSKNGTAQVCHEFTFTHVFGPETDQQQLYDNSMREMMRNFLRGQNCLVFAYGATNAGKTYTMQGFQDDPGILPRSLDTLFNSIKDCVSGRAELMPVQYDTVQVLSVEESRREEILRENLLHRGLDWDGESSTYLSCDSTVSRSTTSLFSDDSLNGTKTKSSRENLTVLKENLNRLFASVELRVRDETTLPVDDSATYTVWVSFCEIYNEYIHDLLDCENQNARRRPILKLAGDMRGNIYVKGGRQFHVTSADEAVKLILIGQRNLRVASTKLNQKSSRSHSIFTVKLVRSCTDGRSHKASVQLLSFCDLAGSERYAKTQSHGERLTEAKNINTSLLVLGRCIHMLRENQCNKDNMKLIPFRESKLTHLLQNFFVKKGKVSMVVNISQDGKVFDENLHVLKYSAVAKQVRIVPDLNATRPQRGTTKVSLILQQGFGSRSSVAWSTASSDPSELKSLSDTVFEGDESEDDSEDDIAIGDKTLSELYTQIDSLQKELAKEKKAKQDLEREIRSEVAAEVQVCIEEMENYYKGRIEEVERDAEELADQRLAIYMRAMKRHKETASARSSDDDGEGAKELENQVKAQAALIESLQMEIEDVKSQLAKESSENRACQAVLAEVGCTDLLEVKQLFQKEKDLTEEIRSLTQRNVDNASAYQVEKEILEEQLQCLREKFASEVNKTLLLQHDFAKREKEFAEHEELFDFLSKIGCADVTVVREQWTKFKLLQETEKCLLQELGCANALQIQEEWERKERLISELTRENETYTSKTGENQLLRLKSKDNAVSNAEDDAKMGLNDQLANAQNLLDDLGISSLAALREEWILRFTIQQELTETNRGLQEHVATLEKELGALQQLNENCLCEIALLKSDKKALQDINDMTDEFISLSEPNCPIEVVRCLPDKNEPKSNLSLQKENVHGFYSNEDVPGNKNCEENVCTSEECKSILKDNIFSREEKIRSLRESENHLKEKVLSLEDTIDCLNASKSELEKELSLLEEKQVVHDALQLELEDLKRSLAEHVIHSDVTDDLKAVEAARNKVETAKSLLEQELIMLKQKSDDLARSFEHEVFTLKSANEALLAENAILQEKLKSEHANKMGEEKRTALELQLETKMRESEVVIAQIEEDLRETNKVLEIKNKCMNELMQMNEETEKTVKQLSKKLECVQEEKEELTQQIEFKIKESYDLEQSVERLHNKLDLVQAENLELTEKFKQNAKEYSDAKDAFDKLHNSLEAAQAENVELTEQLKQTSTRLCDSEKVTEKLGCQVATLQQQLESKNSDTTEEIAEKDQVISLLKVELEESRKMEEDNACKFIGSKNKLQEVFTLFGAKTLGDIKVKMNEYEALHTKARHLEEEIAVIKEKLNLSCLEEKMQAEEILALQAEIQEKELAYNEHISSVSQELQSLKEFLAEEFGSLNVKQLRKQVTALHIAKEQSRLLQEKNEELKATMSELQEKSSESDRQLQTKNLALERHISVLQEKSCDCGDFKEPSTKVSQKKVRSRKTRNEAELSKLDTSSGVTTRSRRRCQKSVLEESNSVDTAGGQSDSSASDGSITGRPSSLRSRRLYKENVSILESSPQNLENSKQDSAYSAVMKRLQRN